MACNCDLERGYHIERASPAETHRAGKTDRATDWAAPDCPQQKPEVLWARLDGSYRLPGDSRCWPEILGPTGPFHGVCAPWINGRWWS
jgi:hypothetical protein